MEAPAGALLRSLVCRALYSAVLVRLDSWS